jgi:hypothetical protein
MLDAHKNRGSIVFLKRNEEAMVLREQMER